MLFIWLGGLTSGATLLLVASALNMSGNTLFVAYLLYSTIRYSIYLSQKLKKKDSQLKLDPSLIQKFYAGFVAVGSLQLLVFVMMVVHFYYPELHHSLVIAITSFCTTVLLAFDGWLDGIFAASVGHNLKSSAAKKIQTRKSTALDDLNRIKKTTEKSSLPSPSSVPSPTVNLQSADTHRIDNVSNPAAGASSE